MPSVGVQFWHRRSILAAAFGLDHLARGAGVDAARRHGLRVDPYRRCGGGSRPDCEREWPADRANRPAATRARRHFRDAPRGRDRRSSCKKAQTVGAERCGGSPRLPRRDAPRLGTRLCAGARLAAGPRHRRAARRDRYRAARPSGETRDAAGGRHRRPAGDHGGEVVAWLSAGAFTRRPTTWRGGVRSACADAVARRTDPDAGDVADAAELAGLKPAARMERKRHPGSTFRAHRPDSASGHGATDDNCRCSLVQPPFALHSRELTDFVVVVLGWWFDAGLRLPHGEREPIEVRFLEGPFLAEPRPSPAQRWQIASVEYGLAHRNAQNTAEVEQIPLMRTLSTSSEEILRANQTLGWMSGCTYQVLLPPACGRADYGQPVLIGFGQCRLIQ